MPCVSFNRAFALAPGVHATATNGDLVLLSIPADRYFCLPQAAQRVALAPDGCGIEVEDPSLAELLAAHDLLARGRGIAPRPPRPRPPPAARTVLKDGYRPPRAGDLGPALAAMLDLAAHYYRRPFARILAEAAECVQPPPPEGELVAAVEAFHRWAPYAPAPGQCLVRAFMLRRHLQRRGLGADWVFGVRTWPFHAHCWLQCGDLALDDYPDRVRAYAPILVI